MRSFSFIWFFYDVLRISENGSYFILFDMAVDIYQRKYKIPNSFYFVILFCSGYLLCPYKLLPYSIPIIGFIDEWVII